MYATWIVLTSQQTIQAACRRQSRLCIQTPPTDNAARMMHTCSAHMFGKLHQTNLLSPGLLALLDLVRYPQWSWTIFPRCCQSAFCWLTPILPVGNFCSLANSAIKNSYRVITLLSSPGRMMILVPRAVLGSAAACSLWGHGTSARASSISDCDVA
jgi:hypothetical protein